MALITQRQTDARPVLSATQPLAAAVDTRQFGAAGLVRAFDLAGELASELCAALPAGRKIVLYDPAAAQGVVAARMVSDGIGRLSDDLAKQNKQLQAWIDAHVPTGTQPSALPAVVLAAVPATIKAVADTASMFRSNVSAAGIAYGEGTRELFASSLGKACPEKIAGLGSGYLGERDVAMHDRLLGRLRALASLRAEYANRIAILQKLADAAKGDARRDLADMASAAGAVLKTVDTFVESLRAGEASDKSPLFNAARYLGYAERTAGALVLDFDLRLEGLGIVRDNLFTGQHLRLSGVAFLWYRLHEPDGTLRMANALRRITVPIDVDLRGQEPDGGFWNGR